MRSSKYSSKWCGFLSCCLCPRVSACLFLPAGLLLPLVQFLPSLLIWFGSVSLFFFCHLWGSQSWGCLSCLSVTGRYRCQSLWLTALINVYPGWVCTGDENNISAPKWTIHLTLSVFFFFLPRQLSVLAELLRIEFMGMEHYYSFCCALRVCQDPLTVTHYCAIFFLKPTTGSPSTCPSFLLPTNLLLGHVTSLLCMNSSSSLTHSKKLNKPQNKK